MKRSFLSWVFAALVLTLFCSCSVTDLTDVAGTWKCKIDRKKLYYVLEISPKNSFILARYENKVEVDRKRGTIALLNGRLAMEFPVEGKLKIFTLERRPLALVLKDTENNAVDMEFYPTRSIHEKESDGEK